MSIFALDQEQRLDQRGNPIVNAVVEIGQAGRDPSLFPKIGFADQSRTQQIGSTFTSDALGRFPKVYIDAPYSYRLTFPDGSQELQLFSQGRLEADFTPGGGGTNVIGVNTNSVVEQGSITPLELSQEVRDLLDQIGINSENLSTSVERLTTERIAGATQERLEIEQVIENADNAVRDELLALTQNIQTDLGDLRSTVDQSGAAVSTDIQALTQRVASNESTLTDQGVEVTALGEEIDQTRINLNDQIEALSISQNTLVSSVSDNGSAIQAVADDISQTNARLDGDASARSIEQIRADIVTLENAQAMDIDGAASVQSVAEVNTRIDDLTGEVEIVANDLANLSTTTSTQVGQIQTTSNAAISVANAATNRIDNIDDEPSFVSISSSIQQITSDIGQLQTDSDTRLNQQEAQIQIQSTAISDLENGAQAIFEVQANANDVQGAIGLYNDNGTTRLLLQAEDIVARAPDGAVDSLFSVDGRNFTLSVPAKIPEATIGRAQITDRISSDNYQAGSSGMSIDLVSGFAEFQNIRARGDIEATRITSDALETELLLVNGVVLASEEVVSTSTAESIPNPNGGGQLTSFVASKRIPAASSEALARLGLNIDIQVEARFNLATGFGPSTLTGGGSVTMSLQRMQTLGSSTEWETMKSWPIAFYGASRGVSTPNRDFFPSVFSVSYLDTGPAFRDVLHSYRLVFTSWSNTFLGFSSVVINAIEIKTGFTSLEVN